MTGEIADYESVIGLEVHVQLRTRSKMFCSCRADYQNAQVNTRVCPVCLGLPGALPVINRKAVEYTIMTGLALNCSIPEHSKFDRKNYPYPDLMKGYQISQYDLPLAVGGYLEIDTPETQLPETPLLNSRRRIGVTRVHLEEDVAKLQHFPAAHGEPHSLVDVNRSGVPLMEVVSDPDLRSPEEARGYLTTLHSILQYLGVSTANMQDGSFRCDANVSIRPRGSSQYGVRTEVKNMNSFHSVYMALQFEVERQRRVIEQGGRVTQETRGWVEERNVTVSQRSKEHAHDYRYFPEPDLPPLVIDQAWVEEVRAALPQLATERRTRLVAEYGLTEYDARLLTGSKDMADYFEAALREQGVEQSNSDGPVQKQFAKAVSNWMLGDLSRLMNLESSDITQINLTPAHLAELVALVQAGSISSTMAKTVLEEAFASGDSPATIVAQRGYTQISDSPVVMTAVTATLAANPKAVSDFLAGKDTAARFLVGQVMKVTRGQANPELVSQLVQEELESLRADAPSGPVPNNENGRRVES